MSRSTFSLILLGIGASIFYFFFLDEWQALKLIRADYDAANSAIERLKKIAAKTEELRDTYNSIKAASLGKVERMIPQGPGAADLIADLELLAARNGVKLNSVDFTLPASSEGTSEASSGEAPGEFNLRRGAFTLPISISISGRYDAFRRFMGDLELHERIIDLSAVNFGASEKDDASYTVRANIYYQ